MGKTIGILIFDGAEEMDFVGPWEVMTAAVDGLPGERVLTVAEKADPVVCEKGMRVLADTTYDEAPPLDVVLIPGGSGAQREIDNPATVAWLTRTAAGCSWLTSNPRARETAAKAARVVVDEARQIARREDKARAAGRAVRRAMNRLQGE